LRAADRGRGRSWWHGCRLPRDRHEVNINAVWIDGDPELERHVEWARQFHAALEPFASDRVYVNFLGEEGAARVRSAYGNEKYLRLAAVKS
jgi:hypothetical protein